jgi:alkyl hydroperoxide reductase subunit AhpC
MLTIQQEFPSFTLTACVNKSPKLAFQSACRESYPGKWVVYFFWPMDFTPVCATELHVLGTMVDDFDERDAVLVGASIDTEFVHLAWVRQGEGPDALPFPILADVRRDLSTALGIVDPDEGVAQRATFIVDPSFIIRHVSVNAFSVGRNPKEILRLLDALQTDRLCPSNWQRGDETIVSSTAFFEQDRVELLRGRGHVVQGGVSL